MKLRAWVGAAVTTVIVIAVGACSSDDDAFVVKCKGLGAGAAIGPNDCMCGGEGDVGLGPEVTSCRKQTGQICCALGPWPSDTGTCTCSIQFVQVCRTASFGCSCTSLAPEPGQTETPTCTPPDGGRCCKTSTTACFCSKSECAADETEVASCSAEPPKCTPIHSVPRVEVQDCVTAVVPASTSTATPPSSSSSDAGPSTAKCTDTGHCSPSDDSCSCGTTCIHYGPGGYLCGFSCTKDSDCTGKKDPISGAAYSQCPEPLDTPTMTYAAACN